MIMAIISAHLVLWESRGQTTRQGGCVAAHPGPVAGDRGEDRASGQEDELQGAEAPHHQPHSVIRWYKIPQKL